MEYSEAEIEWQRNGDIREKIWIRNFLPQVVALLTKRESSFTVNEDQLTARRFIWPFGRAIAATSDRDIRFFLDRLHSNSQIQCEWFPREIEEYNDCKFVQLPGFFKCKRVQE